ncbi:MAG: nucleoside recognition protein, partial [Oliverpabstia sp.]|nr:nucleoside recognition protein [Oliverpabstia sp.]
MNYLWGGMILVGVIYGTITGNLKAVTEAAIDSSKEAVNLC